MPFTVNYAGRTVDLFIAQGAQPVGDHKILYGFGDVGGEVTTGLQKLAQTWVFMFLTELGSIQYSPEIGTRFLTAMRLSRIQDPTDVKTRFAEAAELIKQQLNLVADQTTQPLDEQLLTAELTNVALDKAAGFLNMSVTLTSQAEGSIDVFLPVPLAIK